MKRTPSFPHRARGAALVVGMMLLILVTLLAVVAMRQSIGQERMAGGLRNATMALGGAESAMREAERFLWEFPMRSNGQALVGDVDASQGVYDPKALQITAFRKGSDAAFVELYGKRMDGYDFDDESTNKTATLAKQPVYVIQDLGIMRPPGAGPGEGADTGFDTGYGGGTQPGGNTSLRIYRVIGRSTGGLETVFRTAESYYAGRAN